MSSPWWVATVAGAAPSAPSALSVRACDAGEGCAYALTAQFSGADVEAWSGAGAVAAGDVVADASGGAAWVAVEAASFRVSLEAGATRVALAMGAVAVEGAVVTKLRYANAPWASCRESIDTYGVPCCWEGADAVYHRLDHAGPAYATFTVAAGGGSATTPLDVVASVVTAAHGNETATAHASLPEAMSAMNASATGAAGAMNVALEAAASSASAHAASTLGGYVLVRERDDAAAATLFVPSRFFESPASGPSPAKLGVTREEWLAYFNAEAHGASVCDPSVDQRAFLQVANGTLGDQLAAFKADPLYELPDGCAPADNVADGTCVHAGACADGYAQAMACGASLATLNVTLTLTDARVTFARVTPAPTTSAPHPATLTPTPTPSPTPTPTPLAPTPSPTPSPTPAPPGSADTSGTGIRVTPEPLLPLEEDDDDAGREEGGGGGGGGGEEEVRDDEDSTTVAVSSVMIRGGVTAAMFTNATIGLARAFEAHFREVTGARAVNITCVCEGQCAVVGGVDLAGDACGADSAPERRLLAFLGDASAGGTNGTEAEIEVQFIATYNSSESAEDGERALGDERHYAGYARIVEEATGIRVEVERTVQAKEKGERVLREVALHGGTLALLVVLGAAACVTFLACVAGKYSGLEAAILTTRPRGSSCLDPEALRRLGDGPVAHWRPKRRSSDPLGLAQVHFDLKPQGGGGGDGTKGGGARTGSVEGHRPASFVSVDLGNDA